MTASVILSVTATYVKAVFNTEASEFVGYTTVYKHLTSIADVQVHTGGRKGTYVEMHFEDKTKWTLDVENSRGIVVSSGITATDNEVLAANLAALMK